MSVDTDFIALYRELGIEPESSPEAFKRAYRRRVSELHPDRTGDGAAGEEALKMLNLGCAAALEFHRAHGRFPGAAPSRSRPAAGPAPGAIVQAPIDRLEDLDVPAPPRRRWAAWLALLALAAFLLVTQLAKRDARGSATDAADHTPTPPSPAQPAEGGRAVASLHLGMAPEEALSILGAPTDRARDGRHWHYGPSWIRIACGQVSDWYSSPLKPLAGSRMRPGPEDLREDTPLRRCADPDAPPRSPH